MDPRLTYKIGKDEFVKSPCVRECAGCPRQFSLVPPEAGKTFCTTYPIPTAKWTGKIRPFMYVPKPEKEQKMNPIKASRRGMKQTSFVATVAAATGSKELGKKKTERRDLR